VKFGRNMEKKTHMHVVFSRIYVISLLQLTYSF